MIQRPVLGDDPPDLLTSCDLEDAKRRWEWALVLAEESENDARERNAIAVIRAISQLGYTKGRLLDVGSYTGRFLHVAAECGWETYGLEPLPGLATYARARYGLTVLTDVLRPGLFPDGFFDVVTCFQVFEHLPDVNAGMAAIRSLLRTDGLAVIEVPNIACLGVRLLGARYRHFVPDHFQFFSPDTLSRLLTAHGFTVVRMIYPTRWMSLKHLMSWIERILGWHCNLSLSVRLQKFVVPVNVGDIICAYARREA